MCSNGFFGTQCVIRWWRNRELSIGAIELVQDVRHIAVCHRRWSTGLGDVPMLAGLSFFFDCSFSLATLLSRLFRSSMSNDLLDVSSNP